MSDDLVKCLWKGVADVEQQQDAADRIEQLAAINEELEAKLSESEALLAKAVTSLQHIAANKITDELTVIEWDTHDTFTVLDTCISKARTTLAELKGEP